MPEVTVRLTSIDTTAVMDILLAVEGFAERMYGDRRTNLESQERFNALAAVVLPLRDAMDAANGDEAD